MLAATCLPANLDAAELGATESLFRRGQYEQCLAAAGEEVDRGIWNERWPRLLIRCQLATGRYEPAKATYEAAVKRYPQSLDLRLLGYDVYCFNNQVPEAKKELAQVYELARQAPWRYSRGADLIALGRYFVHQQEDAKRVLELFYDRALKTEPNLIEAHVAIGELGLAKHDYQLAAGALEKALKLDAKDPQIAYLLAKAWSPSDTAKAEQYLQTALQLNPRHVPSLLMQIDNLIDAERYDEAEELLTNVLEVNRAQPEAWAYHAVIAHLQGHYQAEGVLRKAGLWHFRLNPAVDHLVGRKLSQKYRFEEGMEYQQRALKMDPLYAPARFQLAQDLLRLGHEEAGWRMADKVFEADGYNVVAHNLVTLHDRLKKFQTLERDGFVVRMDAREARIYGQQVLDLLVEARDVLGTKYDMELNEPVTIEIFPQQKDFAIRTFGLPGGAGFLGVCFGRVITMNSPASQGSTPANWQAVLWHEYCHVVTLTKTANKMPRWLSEGISVYEERQREPSWGQGMTARYREMILGDALTPVSQLSGAFLRPASAEHLQFAYYESSLVVEYLVEKYGLETVQRLLVDLSVGMPINDALQRSTGSIHALDHEFAEFAKQRAKQLGGELDWDRGILPPATQRVTLEQWQTLLKEHPKNFWVLRSTAAALIQADKSEQAAPLLELLLEQFPDDVAPGNAWELTAAAARQAQDAERERKALEALATRDANAMEVYIRLMELGAEAEDWEAVRRSALRMLAVNPLLPLGQSRLAEAAEKLGQHQTMAAALRAQTEMDPVDPANLHFRLATALSRTGNRNEARREVLKALEQAPRYRAAHKLLLELVQQPPAVRDSKKPDPSTPESKAPAPEEPAPKTPTPKAPAPKASTPKEPGPKTLAPKDPAPKTPANNEPANKEPASKEVTDKEATNKEPAPATKASGADARSGQR